MKASRGFRRTRRRLVRGVQKGLRVVRHLPTPAGRRLPARVVWRQLSGRVTDRKVDFVVAGAMRCGTTSLFGYISQHPEVCAAAAKEVHFFDRDSFFAPAPDYAKYHAWFALKPGDRVLGEASPNYMYKKACAERMHAYNPSMKLIMILRDPVERAYSNWNKLRHDGLTYRTFSEEIRRFQAGRTKSIVEKGFYARQIERMWRYFPREQTLILRTEHLEERHEETMDAVYGFLSLSPFKSRPRERRELGSYSDRMSEAERTVLRTIYEPEVRALEALLGWDCSGWLA